MTIRIIGRIFGDEVISKQQLADMTAYVERVGAAFQIQDDLMGSKVSNFSEKHIKKIIFKFKCILTYI